MGTRILAVVLLAALAVGLLDAQAPLRVPRISQGAKVTQTIGLSEVTIVYSRPGVKGREIWGGLLKYGEVWRAGANEPTLFTFSDEVTIEGKKMAAGTYRLVVIPQKDGPWDVIFNSEVKNWGTVYDPKYDTVKIAVKPETGPMEEWMSYSFTDLTIASARCELAWEKVRLCFKVEFNTLAKMQASVGTWQILNGAARAAIDNKMYSTEAMSWADRSIALDRNPRNLATKAELLAMAGKYADAVALAQEAVKLAKERDAKANTGALEKMIEEWKKK